MNNLFFENTNGMDFENNLEKDKEYGTLTYLGTSFTLFGTCRYYVDFNERLEEGYGYLLIVQNISGNFTDHGETYELYYYRNISKDYEELVNLIDSYCKEKNISNNIILN